MHYSSKAAMLAFAALGLASTASAANLVSNGSFEQSSYTVSSQFSPQFGGQGVTDWTATRVGGYQAYLFAATASTTDFLSEYPGEQQRLAASYPGASPDGGNFLGLDADTSVDSPIVQSISGLTAGKAYDVSFYWAATQLTNRSGPTTNSILVSLGNSTQSTAIVNVPNQGFVGWMSETFRFTATGSTENLSFLAVGGPGGLPPFALLDGVSLTAAVPEPSTWMMMLGGFGFVGFAARRRHSGINASVAA